MTDKSSENGNNSAPSGTEGQGANSDSNQEKNHRPPAEATEGDIDSLLASAAEALEQVDRQLGEAVDEAKTSDNEQLSVEAESEKSAVQETPTLGAKLSEVSDVDQTLTAMQQEAAELNQQAAPDEAIAPEATGADDSFDSRSKKENETDSVGEDTLNASTEEENVDDILSAMAEELAAESDDLNAASAPMVEEQSAGTTASEVTAADEDAAGAEIDAVLAELEEDIEQSVSEEAAISSSETAPTTEQALLETPPEESAEPSSDTTAEAALEPTGETADESEDETTPEQKQESNQDDQIVTQELTDKETAAVPFLAEESEKDSAPAINYDHFCRPLRLLLKVIFAVNRPFGFLPDSVREILGLIGLVTCIVSILTVALLLLF